MTVRRSLFARIATSLVMFVSVTNGGFADDASPDIFVSNQQLSCEEYLLSKSGDQRISNLSNAWIEGYLAGYNDFVDLKRYILTEDMPGIFMWVEHHCEKNRSNSIDYAIRHFLNEVAKTYDGDAD